MDVGGLLEALLNVLVIFYFFDKTSWPKQFIKEQSLIGLMVSEA